MQCNNTTSNASNLLRGSLIARSVEPHYSRQGEFRAAVPFRNHVRRFGLLNTVIEVRLALVQAQVAETILMCSLDGT